MRISDWSSDVCSSDLVDLAQALLVVDVVAVLAAVAVTGGPGDNGADLVALLLQPPQLLLKARETLGRDQAAEIVGNGPAATLWSPPAVPPRSEELRVGHGVVGRVNAGGCPDP